jgi:endonuclease YncB( thermonuclease family)
MIASTPVRFAAHTPPSSPGGSSGRGWWAKALMATGLLAIGNTTGFLAGKKYSDYEHSLPPAVMSVYDGDTLTLSNRKSVRIYGIDAPELHYRGEPPQPFATEARRFLDERMQGQRFECEEKGVSFGRDVCETRLNGQNIGLEMVRHGLAYAELKHTSAKDRKLYQQAEAEARDAKRGVWSLPGGGERPWDYRTRILKEHQDRKAEKDRKASHR